MALVQVTYFYAISKLQVAARFSSNTWSHPRCLFSMCFWKERPTATKLGVLSSRS